MQWRVEIGIFNEKCKVKFLKKLTSQKANGTSSFCSLGILFVIVLLMLLVCDDIELNLGPRKRYTCYNLSVFHWNLNIIAAHNFKKVNLLEAYNTVNTFDIVYLSETDLDSSIFFDDDNLVSKVYELVRDDHPANIKRGGVCAYIRQSLPVRCLVNSQYLFKRIPYFGSMYQQQKSVFIITVQVA